MFEPKSTISEEDGRKIFHVDVGDMSFEEASNYLNVLIDNIENNGETK